MDSNIDQTKGKIKQAIGDLTDDKALHREGKADETGGKVKEMLHHAEDSLENVVDKVKDKFSKD